MEYIDNTKTVVVFTYDDKDGVTRDFFQVTPVGVSVDDDNREVPEENLAVAVWLSALPQEVFPVKNVRNLEIRVAFHDGLVLPLGMPIEDETANAWFHKPSTISTGLNKRDFFTHILAAYGEHQLHQNTALGETELHDNPMFKKGMLAMRQGMLFSEWFIDMANAMNHDKDRCVANGMSAEVYDRLKNRDQIGIPMSVASQVVDGLGISLDFLFDSLTQHEILQDHRKEKQDDGVQPQAEVPQDASGAADVPNDPVPLEGKPEER